MYENFSIMSEFKIFPIFLVTHSFQFLLSERHFRVWNFYGYISNFTISTDFLLRGLKNFNHFGYKFDLHHNYFSLFQTLLSICARSLSYKSYINRIMKGSFNLNSSHYLGFIKRNYFKNCFLLFILANKTLKVFSKISLHSS